MFALWFVAPGLRRVFGLLTGYVGNDPLSLAPFLATGAIAVLALAQTHIPSRIRRHPAHRGRGLRDRPPRRPGHQPVVGGLRRDRLPGRRPAAPCWDWASEGRWPARARCGASCSTASRVIAAYAVPSACSACTAWDQEWLDAGSSTSTASAAVRRRRGPRLQHAQRPGDARAAARALAAVLPQPAARAHDRRGGRAAHARGSALTSVRSAWVALIAGGIAHVVASRGRAAPGSCSARAR